MHSVPGRFVLRSPPQWRTCDLPDMRPGHTFCKLEYDFDPSKSDRNERERGFGFAFASLVFERRAVEVADTRFAYGEPRTRAIGEIDGVIYAVVYTDRDGVRRIISARIANRRERELWHSSE
jgi:uncharacterized DUF497 family protein